MREQGAVGKQARHPCSNARADSSPPDYHKRYPRQLGSVFDNLDPTRNEQTPVGDPRKQHSLNMSLRRIKFPTFKRFLQLKRAMYNLVTNRSASHAESIFLRFSVVPGDLPGIEIGDLAHARNRTAQRGAV